MEDITQEMSGVITTEKLAVDCRDLYKHYGSGKNRLNVLQGLNMAVPQGCM